MKEATAFTPGDKVCLADNEFAFVATVPKLKPGRLYCVRQVFVADKKSLWPGHQRLHLCGVHLDKRMRNPNYGLPSAYFRPVGRKEVA